jgi:DNA-binding CsgD family transcriptional regulator
MITLEKQSEIGREISSADNRAMILLAMKKIPMQFRMQHFSLMQSPGPDDLRLEPLVVCSTLSPYFYRELDKRKLLQICPIVPMMKNMALPLCWSYLERESGPQTVVMPQAIIDFFSEYDIATSVIMPLRSRTGNSFIARLDGNRELLTLPELNEVGMLVLQAFTIFDRIGADEMASQPVLTARELEVLRWTSRGKTSVEIAEILSLSDHTVNAYLNKAIRKLDCVNRTQLVAKAIRLRLIS